ncbi:MAG: AAA family ATPase, partial [Bacteroidota bacterium]
MDVFYSIRNQRNIKKKPSTSELIDWIKLLMVGKINENELDEVMSGHQSTPYLGALLKNEHDKHVVR